MPKPAGSSHAESFGSEGWRSQADERKPCVHSGWWRHSHRGYAWFRATSSLSAGSCCQRRAAPPARPALRLAAVTFGEPDTTLSGICRRLSARTGDAKAITTTAAATIREMGTLFCDALRYGVEYVDPDTAYN